MTSACELHSVGFLVVCKCLLVLLSCRMLIVVMMDKWTDDSAC